MEGNDSVVESGVLVSGAVSFTTEVVGLGRCLVGSGGRRVVSERVIHDKASVKTGVGRTGCKRDGTSFVSGLRVTLGRATRARC